MNIVHILTVLNIGLVSRKSENWPNFSDVVWAVLQLNSGNEMQIRLIWNSGIKINPNIQYSKTVENILFQKH